MENKRTTILCLMAIAFGFIQLALGFRLGVKKGIDDGIVIALDTIISITNKQLECDTCVSSVTYVRGNGDSLTYILSKKTLTKK